MPSPESGPSWQIVASVLGGLVLLLGQLLVANYTRGIREDVRDVKAKQDEQHDKVLTLYTTVFGVTGTNGINGAVKALTEAEKARTKAEADRLHKETNRRGAILTRLLRLEEHNGLEPMHPRGEQA